MYLQQLRWHRYPRPPIDSRTESHYSFPSTLPQTPRTQSSPKAATAAKAVAAERQQGLVAAKAEAAASAVEGEDWVAVAKAAAEAVATEE